MQAERSLVEAKEQCVLLANNIQELEREVGTVVLLVTDEINLII